MYLDEDELEKLAGKMPHDVWASIDHVRSAIADGYYLVETEAEADGLPWALFRAYCRATKQPEISGNVESRVMNVALSEDMQDDFEALHAALEAAVRANRGASHVLSRNTGVVHIDEQLSGGFEWDAREKKRLTYRMVRVLEAVRDVAKTRELFEESLVVPRLVTDS
jgi:hypothetical protein